MEKFQHPFNPSLVIGEEFEVGWLEEFVNNIGNNNNYNKFEVPYYEQEHYLEDNNDNNDNNNNKMPFLQMLQGVDETTQEQPTSQFMHHHEQNYFQLLLKLQHQKLTMVENHPNNLFTPFSELDSCVTTNVTNNETFREEDECQGQVSVAQQCSSIKGSQVRVKRSQSSKTAQNVEVAPKERRKRKRPVKESKNKEEVETQRMTHIAVERNRRRQMNDHLNGLRSLMPPSYVQRGDQASIIGGAIDFVKEMEQLLQSLQAQKKMKQHQSQQNPDFPTTTSTASSSSNMLLTSPTSPFEFTPTDETNENSGEISRNNNNEEYCAENRSPLADIKVIVIQNHVNLKIQCQRKPGQLLKLIVAFEQLRLTILHLNITSLHSFVLYSFNLKIEDECKLGSADEVVRAVHHIFSFINLS